MHLKIRITNPLEKDNLRNIVVVVFIVNSTHSRLISQSLGACDHRTFYEIFGCMLERQPNEFNL